MIGGATKGGGVKNGALKSGAMKGRRERANFSRIFWSSRSC